MQRRLLLLITFLTCFGVGSLASLLLLKDSADNDRTVTNVEAENTSVAAIRANEFRPEFVDLPSFEDYDAYRKPKGRLIHIFENSVYRESEVIAESGESWLVLVRDSGIYSLRESTASVRRLKSKSWPGDERDAKLSFTCSGKPILALKYFSGLHEHTVRTLHFQPEPRASDESEALSSEMSSGFDRQFDLGDTRYRLRVSTGKARDGTQLAVLVLESGTAKQVIMQTQHFPSDARDTLGNLIWVGDLDGDNRLDLYFDEFNENGYTGTQLHLSSAAGRDELIGFAAWFGAAGC